jgi:hypothetical protein
MTDRVITPEMAVTLHAEGIQRRDLPAWIVFRDEPDYSRKVIARFATDTPTTPVLVADPLTEPRAMLPPGLRRTKRHAPDPPEILEMWSEAEGRACTRSATETAAVGGLRRRLRRISMTVTTPRDAPAWRCLGMHRPATKDPRTRFRPQH